METTNGWISAESNGYAREFLNVRDGAGAIRDRQAAITVLRGFLFYQSNQGFGERRGTN